MHVRKPRLGWPDRGRKIYLITRNCMAMWAERFNLSLSLSLSPYNSRASDRTGWLCTVLLHSSVPEVFGYEKNIDNHSTEKYLQQKGLHWMAQPDACAIGCRLCVVISCRFHVCQQLRTTGKGLENCDLQGAERVQPHPPERHLLGGTLRRSCIAQRLVSQFSVSAALLFAWISRITCKHLPLSSIISVGNQFGFNRFEYSMQSGPSGLRRFPRKAISSERVVYLSL